MPGRPCTICSDSTKARRANEMIAAGAPDQAVADAVGVGRMAAARHRHNHFLAPARALTEAAGKGSAAKEKRAEIMASAAAGDPSAFIALGSIVADLRTVHARLERTAEASEHDGQRLAVASLSGQQLRAAEVRAKIGGVGAFAPQKVREVGDGVAFQVNINFSNGRTERLAMGVGEAPPTIDADAGEGALAQPMAFLPAAHSLGMAFGHGVNPALTPLDDDD
jgi:hypothetical protein